jgi:hypothetical protein
VLFHWRNCGLAVEQRLNEIVSKRRRNVSEPYISDTQTNATWGPVAHFHFTAWPDFGVADSTKSIIRLVKYVRASFKNQRGKQRRSV